MVLPERWHNPYGTIMRIRIVRASKGCILIGVEYGHLLETPLHNGTQS